MTDYDLYPLWVNRHTDYYIVPSAKVVLRLHRRPDIKRDRIKLWGIPLRRQFFKSAAELADPGLKRPEGLFTFFLFGSDR